MCEKEEAGERNKLPFDRMANSRLSNCLREMRIKIRVQELIRI